MGRIRALWFATGLLLAACGDSGSETQPRDAAPEQDGCVSFAALVCSGNDTFWEDSCGELGELAEECTNLRPCNADEGRCCSAARASGPTDPLVVALGLTWSWQRGGTVLELPLDPNSVADSTSLPHLIGWRFTIGGEALTFALRTTLFEGLDERGAYVVLDSTPATPSILRLGTGSQPTTFNGTYGAMLEYDWAAGPVTLKLVVSDDDWVDAFLVRDQIETLVGGLMIPGAVLPTSDVGILHVLGGATDYSEVPLLDLGFSAPTLDGAAPSAGVLTYTDFVNVDVAYTPAVDLGRIRIGGLTPQCQRAGPLL